MWKTKLPWWALKSTFGLRCKQKFRFLQITKIAILAAFLKHGITVQKINPSLYEN